jgi:hypothetical protein
MQWATAVAPSCPSVIMADNETRQICIKEGEKALKHTVSGLFRHYIMFVFLEEGTFFFSILSLMASIDLSTSSFASLGFTLTDPLVSK